MRHSRDFLKVLDYITVFVKLSLTNPKNSFSRNHFLFVMHHNLCSLEKAEIRKQKIWRGLFYIRENDWNI